MLQNDLDLVLHLGDYTYEYAIQRTNRRGGYWKRVTTHKAPATQIRSSTSAT